MKKYIILILVCLGWLVWAKIDVIAVKQIVVTPTTSNVVTPTLLTKSNNLMEAETMKWNGFNSIQKLIRIGIDRGVASNTIVLLLMLPLVATIVSVLHYMVGLSGYGIFIPTMIAVVFLATGILGGVLLFATVLIVSIVSNYLLKRFKLHFWPARSINLLFISVGTFGLMIGTSYLELFDLSKISIFPVLFMVLLVEEFSRTQLAKSRKEAFSLTLGTLVLAVAGALLMGVREVQEWVIGQPELTLIVVLVVNLLVGSYTGIRLVEIKRFAKAIRKKG
ncbi:MAG: hypothetical protein NTY75_03555 [Candidatus Shapirobacteria bacterium]|nr:hypothetical protein [Candidatus Shapirobacteria bacterium]